MVTYAQNELMSITEFTKSISKVLGDIKAEALGKVGILKNNKLEAVVISTQEYDELKNIQEYLEAKEDEELLKIAQERMNMPSKGISHQQMLKMLDIDPKDLK